MTATTSWPYEYNLVNFTDTYQNFSGSSWDKFPTHIFTNKLQNIFDQMFVIENDLVDRWINLEDRPLAFHTVWVDLVLLGFVFLCFFVECF